MSEIHGSLHDGVYCYEGGDVLVNRLGIRDQSVLQMAERELTTLREAQLMSLDDVEVNGFGLNTLSRIHAHLFQDVYEWAGKSRECDISRNGIAFSPVETLKDGLHEVRRFIRDNGYFRDMSDGDRLCSLALVHNQINCIHPFREGNGRTGRIFMQFLAARSGLVIEWDAVGKDELDEAFRQARRMNLDNLEGAEAGKALGPLAFAYAKMTVPAEYGRMRGPRVRVKKEPRPFFASRSRGGVAMEER